MFAWEKAVRLWDVCFFFVPLPVLCVLFTDVMAQYIFTAHFCLSFVDYLTCGTIYVLFVCNGSGKELYFSAHMSVCGPSAPVLSWQYIIKLLMFLCVFRLQKYEVISKLLLPKSTQCIYCIYISDFPLLHILGKLRCIISAKVMYSFKDFASLKLFFYLLTALLLSDSQYCGCMIMFTESRRASLNLYDLLYNHFFFIFFYPLFNQVSPLKSEISFPRNVLY